MLLFQLLNEFTYKRQSTLKLKLLINKELEAGYFLVQQKNKLNENK